MLGISGCYSHFMFGVIHRPTRLIAAAIASVPAIAVPDVLKHWLLSWPISWAAMTACRGGGRDQILLGAADAQNRFTLFRMMLIAGQRTKKAPPGRAGRGRRLLEAEVLGCNTVAKQS